MSSASKISENKVTLLKTIVVEKLEAGVYGDDERYVRIRGRDDAGKFVRCMLYRDLAVQLERQISNLLAPNEEVNDRAFEIKVEGSWYTKEKPGYPKPDISFVARNFELLSGPSVVLSKAQREATVALAEAEAFIKQNDFVSAYKSLEPFVAKFTGQPAPSLDMENFSVDSDDENIGENLGSEVSNNLSSEPSSGDASLAEGRERTPEDIAKDKISALDSRHAMPNEEVASDVVFGADIPSEEAASVEVVAEDDEPAADAVVESSSDEPAADVKEEPSVDKQEVAVESSVDKQSSAPVRSSAPSSPSRRVVPGVRRPPALVNSSPSNPSATSPEKSTPKVEQGSAVSSVTSNDDDGPVRPSRPGPVPRMGGIRPRR